MTCTGKETVPRNLARWSERLAKVLAGKVSFGSAMNDTDKDRNIDCSKSSGVTPASPNTDFTIAHTLGRVPLTLAGWDTNNGGVLYRGSVAWTSTTVTLRCTVASSSYNVVII